MRPFLLLACLLLLAGCQRQEPPLEVLGSVPDFTLTAHTGATFSSQAELKGRIWVADFIFTNCKGPCPRMSSQMRQIQQRTADLKDLRLVSFTVDPERDTPQVLAEYAQRYHADGRWVFLTGPMPALNQLKRHAFLLGNVDGQLNHSTRFVLVDRKSRIRGYYDTSEPGSVAKVVADIRRLVAEGSG